MSLFTFRNLIPFSELLAAIVGTIYFFKYKHTSLKYFLFLLWYITLTEFTGWYVIENEILPLIFLDENGVKYNLWMYNLLRFITFNTLFFIYYNYLNSKIFKKWIKIFAIIYISICIINWSFIQSFIWEKSEIPKIIGSIFLIITIVFYFIESLKSEKIVLFHKRLLFWISIGLLLFYTGTIPFALKYNTYMLIPGIHKLFLIIWILALILNLIFTLGFIWSDKEK